MKSQRSSHLEELLTGQWLGGDQQALVVARYSGRRQILVGQLDVLAVVFQKRHDRENLRTLLALSLDATTEVKDNN